MKTLTLSLFATFCTLLTFGQSQPEANTVLSTDPTAHHSQMFLNSEFGNTASLDKMATYSDFASYARKDGGDEDGKCAKYKKLKTTGIIVASVGGGLFVTGIALMAVGVHEETNWTLYGTGSWTTGVGLVGGGATCFVFGLIGVGAGVPLAVIGSVKSRKYCGDGSRRSMVIGTNGNNLALNF